MRKSVAGRMITSTCILRQLASKGTGIITAIFPSTLLLAASLSIRVLCPLLIVAVTLMPDPGEGEPSAFVTTAYARVNVSDVRAHV